MSPIKKGDPKTALFKCVLKALRLQLLAQVQYTWCRNEDGAVRTDDHTDHQGEYKAFDVVASEEEDGQQYHERRERGVDGTAQRAVEGVVHHLLVVAL